MSVFLIVIFTIDAFWIDTWEILKKFCIIDACLESILIDTKTVEQISSVMSKEHQL